MRHAFCSRTGRSRLDRDRMGHDLQSDNAREYEARLRNRAHGLRLMTAITKHQASRSLQASRRLRALAAAIRGAAPLTGPDA